jgi:hypothetical protein
VTIIGATSTAQQCLKAGLADELHIDSMPVLLGGGLRFFEDLGMETIQLEKLRVQELPGGRTHLRLGFVRGQGRFTVPAGVSRYKTRRQSGEPDRRGDQWSILGQYRFVATQVSRKSQL